MLAENNSSSIQAIEADDENFNIDELEANLEAELESQLRDLSFLEEERAKLEILIVLAKLSWMKSGRNLETKLDWI